MRALCIAFLLLLGDPTRMPEYGKETPPAPRPMKEVRAAMAGAPAPPAPPRELTLVLVSGRKDHGLGEHDYPAWKKVWATLLGLAPGIRVRTADEWPSPEDLAAADVLLFFQQGKWTPERAKDLDAHLARGGGAVYLHYAVDGGSDSAGFAKRIGLAWQGGRSKYRHGNLELAFEPAHEITRNLERLKFQDESYWNLVGDAADVKLVATGMEEGRPQPLMWTREVGKGRVFACILGHNAWTFDDPLFRLLVLRGAAWTAKEPVDRFNELVFPDARITD
jgi:type 1 glutamine amidotransferase